MQGLIPLLLILTLGPSIAYGVVARTLRTPGDVVAAMAATMSSLAYYMVMVFFAALFTRAARTVGLAAAVAPAQARSAIHTPWCPRRLNMGSRSCPVGPVRGTLGSCPRPRGLLVMTLRTRLALLSGVPITGLLLSVAVSYTLTNVTTRGVTLAKDESAVYASLARDMQLNVVQVQQWLTDISATRGQDGLDDGFDEAEASRAAFLTAVGRFEEMYRREGDTQALDRMAALRRSFEAYYQAGRSMAHAYVEDGTSAGNAKMGSFDEAAQAFRDSLDPLVEQQSAELESNLADVSAASVLSLRLMVIGGLVLSLSTLVLAVTMTRAITRPIRSAADSLAVGAQQTAAAAKQVSTSAQSLSQGTTEQAASLEETSASMEEMAAMTRQNADQSRRAADLMTDVYQQVSRSSEALGAMVVSMAAIQDSSAKVARIIKTIDEIAFQTNILALNAAVEAARAGEAGMGFAVVADEVRSLAHRSARAAKDTAGLIEESSANAAQGAQTVDLVAAAIGEITGSVNQVRELVETVSQASRQQAQGIDQVTQAITQMEKVTQGTAATAEESAAASEELSAQAETTIGAVGMLMHLIDGKSEAAAGPDAPRPDVTARSGVLSFPSATAAKARQLQSAESSSAPRARCGTGAF
jgi:methyl-accepting chemotaxis protein